MKILRFTILFFFGVTLLSSCGKGNTDTQEHLQGLTLATEEQLDTLKIELGGDLPYPQYGSTGNILTSEQVVDSIIAMKHDINYYLDKDGKIAASVLRPFSSEELEKLEAAIEREPIEKDLLGTTAPPFVVTDLEGNTFSTEDLKGKVVVLNFWFVECKPCIQEMPDLNELVQKYKGKDVVFLSFSTSEREKTREFLKSTIFDYHVITDIDLLVKEYGITSFPTNMILDKKSTIVESSSGLFLATKKDGTTYSYTKDILDKTIESLLVKI